MGPIESVGSNSTGWIKPPQHLQSMTAASFGETPVSITGVTTSKSCQSLLTIQASVSKLLQTIGGGLDQNEMLKALIALLLLSALLRSNNIEDQTDQQKLQELGSGNGSMGQQGQFISFYSSSTSFVMESSSPIIAANQQTSAMTGSGVVSAASVSSIDAVA